jgi:hypothetical protein
LQTGLTTNDPILVGQAINVLKDVQNTLVSQQSQLNSQLAAINKLNEFTGINEPQSSTTEGSDLSSLKARLDTLEAKSTTVANTNSVANAVFNGGIVTGDVEFQGAATFIALTTFKGKTVFEGDVTFAGSLHVGSNTVGEKIIERGIKTAKIVYGKPFDTKPVINVTPQDFIDGQYKVVDITVNGFSIELSKPQDQDTKFNWSALQK